mmetsp:Transcript_5970/g.19124  ORF Transcript_5970/g.19124 Transcript_5970/m.19124 type:complete len:266 (-) Transcript_5970:1215-2012(-)
MCLCITTLNRKRHISQRLGGPSRGPPLQPRVTQVTARHGQDTARDFGTLASPSSAPCHALPRTQNLTKTGALPPPCPPCRTPPRAKLGLRAESPKRDPEYGRPQRAAPPPQRRGPHRPRLPFLWPSTSPRASAAADGELGAAGGGEGKEGEGARKPGMDRSSVRTGPRQQRRGGRKSATRRAAGRRAWRARAPARCPQGPCSPLTQPSTRRRRRTSRLRRCRPGGGGKTRGRGWGRRRGSRPTARRSRRAPCRRRGRTSARRTRS